MTESKFFFCIFQGHLISPNNEEYDIIVDMIKERLDEGQGETIYEVGTGGEKTVKSLYQSTCKSR